MDVIRTAKIHDLYSTSRSIDVASENLDILCLPTSHLLPQPLVPCALENHRWSRCINSCKNILCACPLQNPATDDFFSKKAIRRTQMERVKSSTSHTHLNGLSLVIRFKLCCGPFCLHLKTRSWILVLRRVRIARCR